MWTIKPNTSENRQTIVIQTPDLTIAYTGDIRLHGYRENDTLSFCMESENCDVLLIEGVSVSFQDFGDSIRETEAINEPELIEKINEVVNNNPNKQITFNYYISNVERILNIIKTNPRTVVLDAYYSYVVKEASGIQTHYYQLDDKEYGLDEKLKVDFKELLNDKQKLALFGHEARLNAEDYSYDSVKEKWLSIINDILN